MIVNKIKDLHKLTNLPDLREVKLNMEHEYFVEQFVYNTNAIEGSTITLEETHQILSDYLIPDKSAFDIAETHGLANAFNTLPGDIIPLTKAVIQNLHYWTFRHSKKFAGKFREPGTEVVVCNGFGEVIHKGALAETIPKRIAMLIDFYNQQKVPHHYHPIILAAIIHNEFENIHPFEDGNGRVGRLLMNYVLMDYGYPPVIIEYTNRKKYYKTLQDYEKRHLLTPSVDLIIESYKNQGRLNFKCVSGVKA